MVKCRTKLGPGLSLRVRGAHDGINTLNTTNLRPHLVSLRPGEGGESRKEDCGDLSDRDETEGENAHCENAERGAVSHQPELDNLILNSDSGLRGTFGLCVRIQRRWGDVICIIVIKRDKKPTAASDACS